MKVLLRYGSLLAVVVVAVLFGHVLDAPTGVVLLTTFGGYVGAEMNGWLALPPAGTIPDEITNDPIARKLLQEHWNRYHSAVSSSRAGQIAYHNDPNAMLDVVTSSIKLAGTAVRTVFHVGGKISVEIWTTNWRPYVSSNQKWLTGARRRYFGRIFVVSKEWRPTPKMAEALFNALDANVAAGIDIYCYAPSLDSKRPSNIFEKDMVIVDEARVHLLEGKTARTGHTHGILFFSSQVKDYVDAWDHAAHSSMSFCWSDPTRRDEFRSLIDKRCREK